MRSCLRNCRNFQHQHDIVIPSQEIAPPLCAIEHSGWAVFRRRVGADPCPEAGSVSSLETGISLAQQILVTKLKRATGKV
jgi:hypothetical protein